MDQVITPHDDALVITTEINSYDVKRVMVDLGSSMNIIFLDTLTSCESQP